MPAIITEVYFAGMIPSEAVTMAKFAGYRKKAVISRNMAIIWVWYLPKAPQEPFSFTGCAVPMRSLGMKARHSTMLISPIRYTRKLSRQLMLARSPAMSVATTPPIWFMADDQPMSPSCCSGGK